MMDVLVTRDNDSDIEIFGDDEIAIIEVPQQGPPGAKGNKGDKGDKGEKGDKGDTGTRGSRFYTGVGAPGDIAGSIDGDDYLDAATGNVYSRALGDWSAVGKIRGPQGIQGIQGIQGVQGQQGIQGPRGSLWYLGNGAPGAIAGAADGDKYLDTANGDVYSRAAGAWSITGSIRGPQGIQGPTGEVPEAPSDGRIFGRSNRAWVDSGAVFVSFNGAQPLTAAQQQQARQNVYAAPFDALAYSGLQTNGGHEISQENAGTVVSLNASGSKYVVDGWAMGLSHPSATLRAQQQPHSSFPWAHPLGKAFNQTLVLWSAVAYDAATATNYAGLFHFIEGYRWARLGWGSANAQPVTIGFWTTASSDSTLALSVRNAMGDRSFVVTFPSKTNVWEYRTITIPGDVAGTWDRSNGVGASIAFATASGTQMRANAEKTWLAGNFVSAPNATNPLATSGQGFYILGCTIHPGNEAPSAARSPFIQSPYDRELAICQRYYWKTFPYAVVPQQPSSTYGALVGVSAGTFAGSVSVRATWPVPMRATPTVKTYNTSFADANWYDASAGASRAAALADVCDVSARIVVNQTTTANAQHFIHCTADARL